MDGRTGRRNGERKHLMSTKTDYRACIQPNNKTYMILPNNYVSRRLSTIKLTLLKILSSYLVNCSRFKGVQKDCEIIHAAAGSARRLYCHIKGCRARKLRNLLN